MVKRAKQPRKPADSDDDEDSKTNDSNSQIDNDDDDDGAQKMNNIERYYKYKYFEANKNELGQLLLEDAGVDPTQAKLALSKDQLQMTIQSTKSNYSKVANKVKELLSKDVQHVVVDVDENEDHYVPCTYDRRIKKDFRKKFEEKYNVLIMETAKVYYNQGGRGGHGGAQGQRRQPGTF